MKCINQIYKGSFLIHCSRIGKRNKKSNSNGRNRLAICVVTAIAAFMLTACSGKTGMKPFLSSDEAIREYRGFLAALRKDEKASIQTLVKTINEWRVLDDSVSSCMARDTTKMPHSFPYAAYKEIYDSIHLELCRMVISKQRSYRDLLFLKEQTSPHANDEELRQAAKEAQPFFSSLDSIPAYNKGGKQAVLKRYRKFLRTSVKQGIHSKEDLRSFIKEEHRHFKAFLQYLPDFAGDNIGDIKQHTEQCCVQILRAADHDEVSHKDAMIYLSMRTNLRLLRNAQMAIEDLKSGRVKDEQTLHAYLLMMMQPFMSMDDLSVSVLSDKDMADLYKVADSLPKEVDNLAKRLRLDKQRLSDMPMLLMKIYVTRL